MSNNKSVGTAFEREFAHLLHKYGYWVLNVAQTSAGQASDIIAAKNGKAYLIDCKVCQTGHFVFSRAEENQRLSMELWESCGNGDGYFALKLPDNRIYMLAYSTLMTFEDYEYKSMSIRCIETNAISLESWVISHEISDRKHDQDRKSDG